MKPKNQLTKVQQLVFTTVAKKPNSTNAYISKTTKLRPNVVGAAVAALAQKQLIVIKKTSTDVKFSVLTKRSNAGSKNYDKFEVNKTGEKVGKGKLALRILKVYAEKYPNATLADYIKVFPPELQKNYGGVFALVKSIRSDLKRRYFIKVQDLIKTGDGKKIAVSREFGVGNISPILQKAKSLKISVKVYKKNK